MCSNNDAVAPERTSYVLLLYMSVSNWNPHCLCHVPELVKHLGCHLLVVVSDALLECHTVCRAGAID